MPRTPQTPFALYDIDHLLSDEERAVRDTVRRFVVDHISPNIAEWFESGDIPARDLARELGAMGLLGMHLEGYGCAGLGAVDSDPRSRSRSGCPDWPLARHSGVSD